MADIQIVGRGITVNEALREHATASVEDALKVFDVSPVRADVILRHEGGKPVRKEATCEITVSIPKATIRVSESAEKIETAIDKAAAMVSRQLRKRKTKVIDRSRHSRAAAKAAKAEKAIKEAREATFDLGLLRAAIA